MKVPFFDYPRVFLDDKEKLLEIFAGVRRSADLSKSMVDHYKNLSKIEKEVY